MSSGTRSALASLTVHSDPPLLAGHRLAVVNRHPVMPAKATICGYGPRSRRHAPRSRSSRCRSAHSSARRPTCATSRPGREHAGIVLSRSASTTRNRDQASHAQNSTVFTPSTTSPSPQSYCSHIPRSVTHAGAPAPALTCMPPAPCDRPARRALRSLIAQRRQLLVRHVSAICPSTAPSTPRACARSHQLAAACPPPVHSPRPHPSPAHTARPCDASTPPAQRRLAATRSGRTLPAFP